MIVSFGYFILTLTTLLVLGFYFFKSSKEFPRNWYEWKTEFRLQYIGITGLIHDITLRDKNEIELTKQSGRIAVITGGSKGIGLRVVEKLLKCDMTVIIGVRDPKTTVKTVKSMFEPDKIIGKLICKKLDISSLDSVVIFGSEIQSEYKKIDLLINNAGIMCAPFQLTIDGYESHFSTNYLGHFLLTHMLLPQLKAAGSKSLNSRVINVSSIVNKIGRINYNDINGLKKYYPATAYNQSKLAQVLFTKHLNYLMQTEHAHVQIHAVHPGLVDTDLFQHSSTTAVPGLKKIIFKTPEQGSRSVVFAAIAPSLENKGGTYLSNCVKASSHPDMKDSVKCEKLFSYTCCLLNITDFGSGLIAK